jgi:hypothetical protein
LSLITSVLKKVGNSGMKALWVILEAAQAVVARRAEKSTGFALCVTMIYGQVIRLFGSWINRHFAIAADSTFAILGFEHRLIFRMANAVHSTQVRFTGAKFANPVPPFAMDFPLAFAAARTPITLAVGMGVGGELFDGQDSLTAATNFFGGMPGTARRLSLIRCPADAAGCVAVPSRGCVEVANGFA